MPQLYCFHEKRAYTHPLQGKISYVAECGQKRDKCGYYGKKTTLKTFGMQHTNAFLPVNFDLAYRNGDTPTKIYDSSEAREDSMQESNPIPLLCSPLSIDPASVGVVVPEPNNFVESKSVSSTS